MNKYESIFRSPEAERLTAAFLSIDTPDLMKSFLRDILTEKEISEFSKRLKAAEMLINSAKYDDVVRATGLSSRTVARISAWIKTGNGGYAKVLSRIETYHSHM